MGDKAGAGVGGGLKFRGIWGKAVVWLLRVVTVIQTAIMRETKNLYQKEYFQKDPFKTFLYKDDSRLLDEERYAYDHHVTAANRMLVGVAGVAWLVFKEIVKTAVKVPGWFVRVNTTRPNEKV